MANKRRDADKERFWRDVLKRQAASGLSARAFCRRESLTESAFYAWRRIVVERNTEVGPTRQASAFVPMTVVEPSARQASIEIELTGGRLLRLPSTISVEGWRNSCAASKGVSPDDLRRSPERPSLAGHHAGRHA